MFDPNGRTLVGRDVTVEGITVSDISEPGQGPDVEVTVDASGCIVCPGLIDIHTHVWTGVAELAIEPDPYHLNRGTCTIVDAGSAGANTMDGFQRYVIDRAATRILAFLNISGMGILDFAIGELEDIRWSRPPDAIESIGRHPESLVGIKVRLSASLVGSHGPQALALAIEAANEVNLPVMVHIGGTLSHTQGLESILAEMRSGDIVTHCYTSWPPGILADNGQIIDAAVEARERGVLFDVGHGAGSFDFKVAEAALEVGFPPDTISSDLHKRGIDGPVYDLTTTMSKFLPLGVPVVDVLSMVTDRAALAIGREGMLGSLREGGPADITVLKLEQGRFEFHDTEGSTRISDVRLVPTRVVRDGVLRDLQPAGDQPVAHG